MTFSSFRVEAVNSSQIAAYRFYLKRERLKFNDHYTSAVIRHQVRIGARLHRSEEQRSSSNNTNHSNLHRNSLDNTMYHNQGKCDGCVLGSINDLQYIYILNGHIDFRGFVRLF